MKSDKKNKAVAKVKPSKKVTSKAVPKDKHKFNKVNTSTEPGKTPDKDALPDISGLPNRQRLFAEEYLTDHNGTQAAIRAGYSAHSAAAKGCQILAIPLIKAYITACMEDKIAEVRMTRERVLSQMENLVSADANELVQFRRLCCRYCWGKDFMYQRTPSEMKRDRDEHDRLHSNAEANGGKVKVKLNGMKVEVTVGDFDEQGGTGFDRTKEPNEFCPECRGEGIGDVFFKDSRNVSPRARALYDGAQIGKDGIKINMRSRDKAIEMMAKHHKLYDEAPQININMATPAELNAIYESKMKQAREMSAKVIGRSARIAKMAADGAK